MPGRLEPLVTGNYYHIFNRGSDSRNVFLQNRDYKRFKQALIYYRFAGPKPKFSNLTKALLLGAPIAFGEKRVDILAYCLMPNHFHFLVKQLVDGGISSFLSQLSNSYTRYFSTKYIRSGPIFQGRFKAVCIDTDEQLLHVSRYIHINPYVSPAGIINVGDNYEWSSYSEYLSGVENFCSLKGVMGFFKSSVDYKKFVEDQITYGMSLELIKHKLIEDI